MPAKPTHFDGAHFATLHTDEARQGYLLDLTEGVRDNLKAMREVCRKDPNIKPPINFTSAQWDAAVTGQIDSLTKSLVQAGRR